MAKEQKLRASGWYAVDEKVVGGEYVVTYNRQADGVVYEQSVAYTGGGLAGVS